MASKFPSNALSKQQQVYRVWSKSPMAWGYTMFPHHFRIESPGFHFDLVSGAMEEDRLAVAAPRESAKSTILAFLYPFHQLMFRKKRFILIITNTFKKSALHLDSMKKELRDNQLLREAMPGIEIVKDAEGDSVFRHADGFETKVLCKGVDQIGSIRGVKFGAYRPDLIIGDDMEDDELVRNPQRRAELQSAYDEALVPAGEFGKCQYIMIGTILHDDCLLARLVSQDHFTDYKKLFFRARSHDGVSLWPEKWSLEYLAELERTKPTVFAKEYQNDPVAGLNTRFTKSMFHYFRVQENQYVLLDENDIPTARGNLSDCKAAIACDLAWKDRREADSSVIMGGLLTPQSEILIWKYIDQKGLRPDALAQHLFILEEKLRKLTGSVVPIGFEKAMLENVTQWLLKKEMRERNHFLSIKQLIWDADKNTRIETRLQPRYSQGTIYHRRDMGDLEYQLLRFPYGAHDDLVDAEQGLVQLLQFPKKVKAESSDPDDQFMRLRKIAINHNKPIKKRANRRMQLIRPQRFQIPAIEAL